MLLVEKQAADGTVDEAGDQLMAKDEGTFLENATTFLKKDNPVILCLANRLVVLGSGATPTPGPDPVQASGRHSDPDAQGPDPDGASRGRHQLIRTLMNPGRRVP